MKFKESLAGLAAASVVSCTFADFGERYCEEANQGLSTEWDFLQANRLYSQRAEGKVGSDFASVGDVVEYCRNKIGEDYGNPDAICVAVSLMTTQANNPDATNEISQELRDDAFRIIQEASQGVRTVVCKSR